MIFIYEVLYIKELDNINEIFKNASKMPYLLKYCLCLIKKVLCILTIKNNNICILPYKRVKNKFVINIISKIVLKTTKKVVLSNYLNEIEELKESLYSKKIYIYKGHILTYYLIYNIIDYISKIRGENTNLQELFILINNINEIKKDTIIYLSQKFRRINIVTQKIKNFTNISDYLEKLGIAITVTSNKRKSLSKAKFIINFDFDEETLNLYNIKTSAAIIEINNQIVIRSKLFNGINILDFQMKYDNKINDIDYRSFDKKIMYEQSLIGKKYDSIIKQIGEDNVKIINLIGKNGIINKQEYLKI